MTDFVDLLSSYRLIAYAAGVGCILALAMYVTLRAGVFSFGINGFMAIGAYASALCTVHLDLPFVLSLVWGGTAAALVAALVGLPLLRLRGMYFGIATVAFGEVVRTIVSNWDLTGGALGLFGITAHTTVWTIAGCLLLFVYLLRTLEGSVYGKAMRAMQQDEQVATAFGVDVSMLRTAVFAWSAFMAGVAGGLMAHYSNAIAPSDFGFHQLVQITTYTVVGGFSSLLGPLLGAVSVTLLGHSLGFAGDGQTLLMAVIVLLAILFLPRGLIGLPWLHRALEAARRRRAAVPVAADASAPAAGGLARVQRADDNAALVATDLLRRFGGLTAVNGVSFRCEAGRVLGIIGPNGAGKTTVVNLLTGLDRPDGGRVQIGALDITALRSHRMAKAGLARTFQNIRLFGDFSVAQNVLVGQYWREGGDLLRSALGRPDWDARRRREVLDMLALVGLADKADLPARQLSYGQQRRVEIARALNAQPRVLLLDEPTAGMNEEETAELAALILKVRDLGIGVVLIAHDLDLIAEVCDSVVVLNFGTALARGTPAQVRADPRVIEAYVGADVDDDESADTRPGPNTGTKEVDLVAA